MTIPAKVEAYLLALDRALGPIALSERADIVTEIKSHILEAQNREPERSLDSILGALGEPEQVANRYLMERGLQPSLPPKRPIWKWLAIGVMGTFGLACLTTLILVWKFTPLVHIDEEKDRVVLLGGLIDLDGEKGSVRIGESFARFNGRHFTGERKLSHPKSTTFEIPFTNGKIELTSSPDSTLRWDCELKDKPGERTEMKATKGGFQLELTKSFGAKCDIAIPAQTRVKLTGGNGKVEIIRPTFHLDATITNGKVDIRPDPAQKYKFDTTVAVGSEDDFESSDAPGALEIKVAVTNGKIERE